MAKGGFAFREFEELASRMKALEENVPAMMEELLRQAGAQLLQEVRRRTPPDMDGLRESWRLSELSRKDGTCTIAVSSDHPKAGDVEYGFLENGEGQAPRWVAGRFVCTISTQELARRLPKQLDALWKKRAAKL